MSFTLGKVSGSALSSNITSFLDRWGYDDESRRGKFNGSIEVLPSTFYMGEFSLSNGVQAVAFRLADGTKAVGLVNRFDDTQGTISNPKFFALEAQNSLPVEQVSTDVIADGFTLQYTTAGDNLTIDFDFVPATAGVFKAEYWIGTDDTGNKIFDEVRTVTQAEVDAGLPIAFQVGNPYLLEGNTSLFVRFTGIDFKGNSATGLPYFVSKILPYKEVTLNGHVEYVTSDIPKIFIGCDYAVNTSAGSVTLTVPTGFTDKFRVYDYSSVFTPTNKCVVDFTAFGQGLAEMLYSDDDIEFMYINGEWWLNDLKSGNRSKV